MIDIAAIYRLGDEAQRAVRHARVHAAAMITRRRDAHRRTIFTTTIVRTEATRAIRRNARVEVRVARGLSHQRRPLLFQLSLPFIIPSVPRIAKHAETG